MNLKFNLYELEPLILINCLKNGIFLLKIKDSVKGDYFQNEKLGKIFEVLSNYHDKYGTIPKHSTLKVLFRRKFENNSQEYIDIIKNVYEYEDKYDKEYVEEETIKFIKQAKVIEAIKLSIPLIDSGNYDEIYNNIKDAVVVDFDKKLGISFTDEALTKIREKTEPRMSTGFAQLDAVIGGGFENKCVYVFSGIYGIGKSIWLQNIATKQLLNGKNVLYYTLELSEKSVIKRLLSIYSKVNQNDFFDKIEDLEKQFKMLKMITESELWIKEYGTGVATTNHLRAHIEEMKSIKGFTPDIIIVDYCNIMDTLKKVSYENTYVKTKIMYEELRAFAQEINLPIITAAQINRGGMDDKSGMTKQLVTGANISDSFGINATVDGHFIINQTAEEKMSSVMRLFIDKNRQGPDKMTKLFGIEYESLSINEDVQATI